MTSQGVLRSASAQSTSSFDSLDEFLSEFEVINKDDQQALPAPLPLLHQSGDRLRPPRPAVRLSMQPYSATRQSRRPTQGSTPAEALTAAASGGYQNLALLPASEPCGMDAGHLFDAFPGHARSNRAIGGEGTPVQTAPASPLSGYAEQLQRDLGASSGSVPPQQTQSNLAASCPAPSGLHALNQGPSSAPTSHMQQIVPASQAQSTGTPLQTSSRAAASISSVDGAAFTNPLMSMSGRHHVEASMFPVSQSSLQKTEGRASRAGVSVRAEANGQPAAVKQARQQAAARDGIHPLSRSFETLLKEPAVPGSPQQRPHAAVHAAAANIPSSPVPSTVRVAQQTLRKRDYESELLDRLLNSAQQAAAPAQGQQAQAAGAKQPASCLHLPVPRVLLITVVFALMAIPLLLFTAGRVQAQHHMKQQQVYVGSVAVNHSIEGPIPDPVALPAGIDNATGDHHAAAEARDGTLKAALESSQTATDLQDYLSAKERRRGQPGLKLLSLRLTVSLPSAAPGRPAGPRAILGEATALRRYA